MNISAVIRIALVVAAFVSGYVMPLTAKGRTPMPWPILIFLFFATIVCMVVVIGLQRVNPFAARTWMRPSWTQNAFDFHQPLQFFHFAAYVSIAQSLGGVVRILLSGDSLTADTFAPAIVGLGILASLRLLVVLFKSKMES